jgi:hypothetical protein
MPGVRRLRSILIHTDMTSLISREWIESAICDYIAEAKNASYEMAASVTNAVQIIGALPLWADWNGGVAIRPDGELIGFLWDEPQSAKIETDPHLRFLACVAGAEKYSELASLLPTRTVYDRDCSSCNGSGVMPGLKEHGIDPKNVHCYCGGAGWLPANVPDPPGS